MRAIILAAGYARRLFPLTENQPKSLLSVAGRPIIERLLDNLAPVDGLESIHIVTNDKFIAAFRNWASNYHSNNGHSNINIINNEHGEGPERIGAIGNLHLVLTREKLDDDDLIVVAADNLFSESLGGFATFCQQKNAPVLAVYNVGSLGACKKYSSVERDEAGRIRFFEEKPVHPKNLTIGVALYYYPKSSLALIEDYVAEGNNKEEPGRLVEWMYKRTAFYTWNVPGTWYDIGSKEELEDANRLFAKFSAAGQSPSY